MEFIGDYVCNCLQLPLPDRLRRFTGHGYLGHPQVRIWWAFGRIQVCKIYPKGLAVFYLEFFILIALILLSTSYVLLQAWREINTL
jgi:hypothetical protein